MSRIEDIWPDKTNEQVFNAASCLHDYTDEGRAAILAEASRRGLNIAPIVETVSAMQLQASTDGADVNRHCAYCGTRILFGGTRDGALRFCNAVCRSNGVWLAVSSRVPDAIVNEEVWKVHQGVCPVCGGLGPVDVHTSYRVWSALVVTSWSSRVCICCRRCGDGARMRDALTT